MLARHCVHQFTIITNWLVVQSNCLTGLNVQSWHDFSQRKFSGWIFQKLESIFLESIVCIWILFLPPFWQSLWLLAFQSQRTHTASFQAFCVSPIYCRNNCGSGISLHLYLHDDNQQKREKLSPSTDSCFLHNPNSFGRFSSSCHGWLLGNYH